MPVLDTNFLIALDQRDPLALSALEHLEQQWLGVPFQVAAEFLAGVDASRGELAAMNDDYEIVHSTDDIVLVWAELRRTLPRGARPRAADMWIASVAKHLDTFVVTSNKRDFARLGVKAWNFMREKEPPR